jgi:hypothetical protein
MKRQLLLRLVLGGLAICSFSELVNAQSREEVYSETLRPYTAEADSSQVGAAVVDRSSLVGKVMCGYQGWFNAPGDGADRGWVHWNKRAQKIEDGTASFDLWPDMSEYSKEERFETRFKLQSGETATLFSSFKEATVLRHFQWMQEYGIDGVFVQRFATDLRDPKTLRHNNVVLNSCRKGANQYGRAYALMYDLSGLGKGETQMVIDDWKQLQSQMKLTSDSAYLKHAGKPIVALWGIGFNDNRKYTVEECKRLVEFFHDEAQAGTCSLMLGIPTYWREQKADSLNDPMLYEIYSQADVLSPWSVGRFGEIEDAKRYHEETIAKDVAWCRERQIELMPVAFPGFSWHNMQRNAKLDQIPRRKGEFLWAQFLGAKKAGASMLYIAMFDEVDEGTAIFKCINDAPQGQQSKFVTYEGLPSDFYLKLTGVGTRWFRGENNLKDPSKVPVEK